MPLIQVRTFRVRHYECDAYGRVHHASFLRYAQEAAFDASAAAGYDTGRYAEMDRHWLIRETDIEYLHPMRHGDSVEVKTWVADFRRVRSRRAYEFRLVGSGELVAHGYTDWVFLDSATQRPMAIPPEMKTAFFPEGPPEHALPRSRLPSTLPPPPGAFRLRRRVEWRDIDPAQHVNNAAYLAYLEDCRMQAAASYGWPLRRMEMEGFSIVVRRYRIEYRQPAVLDDELEIATWLSDVESSTATRHYAVTRRSADELLARARMLWEVVDVKTEQPIPIPTTFLDDLAPNIADGLP